MMAKVDYSDYIILALLAAATLAYFSKGKLWYKDAKVTPSSYAVPKAVKSRDIVQRMQDSNKNAVIFYGSQTGTAEDYATRLAKEGHQRYGLRTMTADMEEYDYDSLDSFPMDAIAFFVLATYGEGEPTDNSVAFFEFLGDESISFSTGQTIVDNPLRNLKYVAFGLGNKTYEKYNEMIKICDSRLSSLGATRVGECGLGDDGDGTMEEDFLTWKESMWSELASVMGLEEQELTYEPTFVLSNDETLSVDSETVFLGEPSKKHLTRAAKPFNANNPYLGPIVQYRKLFSGNDRHCMHLEVDLQGSGLKYKTGDHIAIWPTNPDQEVDRMLEILDLTCERFMVFRAKAIDGTTKVPVPVPTTYDAVLRFYLEICGPVSRQLLSTLLQFAPNEDCKIEMAKLAQDKDYFHKKVSLPHLNLAQLLENISKDSWRIPFSIFLESLGRLQPRYYSISSSNLVQPNQVSITAVVESKRFQEHTNVLNGVTTNYLLALAQKHSGDRDPHPYGVSYQTEGPRGKYTGSKVPVHIRQSNFKPPSDPITPIVMIGPGTGVAPFRGFIQERAHQKKNGMDIGKTLLFFGCRSRKQDFIYEEEWKGFKKTMGDSLDIDVAFSREGAEKVYVQHRLAARSQEVKELLQEGSVYICGDAAHMAREVNQELSKILGAEALKKLRATQRLQEDVWS